MKKNKNKGFTFIEMLIVVAIIGILASIVLVGLGSFRNRGRDTRRVADLRETQNGLELYYTKNGIYPAATTWQELSVALIGAGVGINVVPDDPTPTWHYGYCISGTTNYVLAAHLEDPNNAQLSQMPSTTQFPSGCGGPSTAGTPNSSAECSVVGHTTDKYCVIF